MAAVAVTITVAVSVAAVVASTPFPGVSSTVKPRFTNTHLIWTPYHYGQFALSLRKESSYIFFKFNPHNKDTPLIQIIILLMSVPLMSVPINVCPY